MPQPCVKVIRTPCELHRVAVYCFHVGLFCDEDLGWRGAGVCGDVHRLAAAAYPAVWLRGHAVLDCTCSQLVDVIFANIFKYISSLVLVSNKKRGKDGFC